MLAQLKGQKPDGYTLGLTPASLAVSPHFQQVEYDLTKDFTYLAAMNTFMDVLTVRSDSPWKTFKDLVEYAKKNPNQIKLGTSGLTGSQALMARYIAKIAGINWTLVPFDSDALITGSTGQQYPWRYRQRGSDSACEGRNTTHAWCGHDGTGQRMAGYAHF